MHFPEESTMTPKVPDWLAAKLAGMPPHERAEHEKEWMEAVQADEDCRTLDALEGLNDLIRDRVRSVAYRYQTGAYIVGRAGTGKTHIVRETLDGLGDGSQWVYRNARISPANLFEVFQQYADATIVIDDVPLLFSNKQGLQILMAALGGDPDKPRPITYGTKGNHQRTEFRGGLIAISNLPLKNDPLAQAIKSRTVILPHEPTDEMLVAKIRDLARKGYKGLTREQCEEVAEFVITECRAGDYRIDLRYYAKGVEDYRFALEKNALSSWQRMVQSGLRSVPLTEAEPHRYTRAEEIEAGRKTAAELAAKYPNPGQTGERNREWRDRTGKAPAAFYRRLKELKK